MTPDLLRQALQADVNKVHILLVEDNPQNRKLARTLLELEGYDVVEAEDAAAALKALEARRPDLILMDIQMPGMDGITLSRRLRERADTRDLPIIALTAYAMKGDRERFIAAGMDGYISKPIDPNTLPSLVRSHLR